ncbi:ATP-binding protein [Parasutterella sp.]|uniref:ATP-binding protein n=1 Tax=Parasutterella sp. TaxID=2049037 RepID=UPI003AB1DF8C
MNNTETKNLKAVNTILGKLEIRQVKTMCPLHGEYLANQVWLSGQIKEISECPECFKLKQAQKAIEEEKARKEEAERNRKQRIVETRMPLEYQTKDFSTFIQETDSQKAAFKLARRFVKGWEKAKAGGYGLLFLGSCGTGKTHLACAIMIELLKEYAFSYPRYYKASEIFSSVRSTYQAGSTTNEEETLKFFSSIQLLVIDEVGVQKGSEAEKRILFSILDNRVTSNKPTILLSNLGPKALEELLGDRLYDRVRSKCVPMLFAGSSMRKPATADLFD